MPSPIPPLKSWTSSIETVLVKIFEMAVYILAFIANMIGVTDEDSVSEMVPNEPRCEKTGLRGFRPGPTQTRLYNHIRWLEARGLKFRI